MPRASIGELNPRNGKRGNVGESTAEVRKRVLAARTLQARRGSLNAQVPTYAAPSERQSIVELFGILLLGGSNEKITIYAAMSISILITSPPDRENVVAELWVEDTQIAEVSNEDNELRVEFYAAPAPNQLSLSFAELIQALEKAKRNLMA